MIIVFIVYISHVVIPNGFRVVLARPPEMNTIIVGTAKTLFYAYTTCVHKLVVVAGWVWKTE